MGNVPAWVAAGVAAVFGIQSWRSSSRAKTAATNAGEEAKRATKAAEKAVTAQQEIAVETRRLADAKERQEQAAEDAPWRIQREQGNERHGRLHNLTATPKYSVRLSGQPIPAGERNSFDVIDGNDSPQIDLMEPWRATVDWTVTVSWYPTKEQVGEPKRQRIRL